MRQQVGMVKVSSPHLRNLGIASLLLLAEPAAAATLSYDAGLGTLPEAQGWTKSEGGPVAPSPTVSGGSLHQGPTSTSGFQYWTSFASAFNFATGTVTVDMRLQVISSSFNAYPRGGYTVFMADSQGRFASLYISSGSVFLGNDTEVSVSSIQSFDSTDGFHDYHLVIDGTGSALSIDGNPIVSMALGATGSSPSQVAFGDGTILGNNESLLASFSISGVTLTVVPEPVSLGLLTVGLAGLGISRRRRG